MKPEAKQNQDLRQGEEMFQDAHFIILPLNVSEVTVTSPSLHSPGGMSLRDVDHTNNSEKLGGNVRHMVP